MLVVLANNVAAVEEVKQGESKDEEAEEKLDITSALSAAEGSLPVAVTT